MFFNESSPVTYPASFTVYTDCNSNFTLYRNGTSINNDSVQSLAASAYNFTVIRTDQANYSNVYDEQTFAVDKGSGSITFAINGSEASDTTIDYEEQINASASTPYGTITIYRNSTDVTSENNLFVTLAANYYEYSAISPGDENHTSTQANRYVTVNRIPSEINLTLNNTNGNITVIQDSDIPINLTTITGDPSATLRLYRAGNLINQGVSPLGNFSTFSSIGSSNITGFYLESENYTESFETWYVNVTEAPDLTNPSVTSLTESPSDPATYSLSNIYQFNATVSDNRNVSTVLFEFDGTNYTPTNNSGIWNFTVSDLSVGVYNYRWYANDTSGNINGTESGSYTIAQASPSLNLIITPSTSETYGTETTATGSGCPSQLTCNLYRNGNLTSNPDTKTLAAGTYNYTYNNMLKPILHNF